MRNLVRADADKICVNFDYRSQEIFIAAYLSGDPQLIAAVEDGDPYIYTARLVKAVPQGATKKSNPVERNNIRQHCLHAYTDKDQKTCPQEWASI